MSEAIERVQPAVLPAPDKPPDQPWFIDNDPEQSVYRFIIAAAKRARQLQAGARPVISTTSRKPTRIAMQEIRQNKIEVQIGPFEEPKAAPAEGEEAEAEPVV